MESYEVQLKDFKKAEQELTGKERVFISQDNNTRSTTIDEIRKPLAEQLNDIEKYRRTISISTEEFEDGVRTDLEILQATHDYIILLGTGTMTLHRNFTISDTFNWNVSRVQIVGNARTITTDINDLAKYAIILSSENLYEYVAPQNNKVLYSTGFELRGNYTCNGINFTGLSQETAISNITFRNINIRHFDIGCHFGSNSYMINLESCVISFNRINIHTSGNNENMGERISFTGCDITGTQGIANSYCIYNDSSTGACLYFTNCSLDWHRRLFFNSGYIVFNCCWIESPQYALDNSNQFGECSSQGYVVFIGGKVLLNHTILTTQNQIDSIFKMNDAKSRIDVTDTLWLTDWYEYISKGNGKLNFKIKSPRDGLDGMNYFLSDSVRNNCVIDSKFSFSNSIIKDKWTISNGTTPIVVPTIGEKKCIAITNSTNLASLVVSLKLPVTNFKSFFKFQCLYYFTTDKAPTVCTFKLYTKNDVYIQYITPTITFANSNSSWVSFDTKKELTEDVVNLDLVDYVSIEMTIDGLTDGETFYLTEANFQSF